jgi:hypothetical protein
MILDVPFNTIKPPIIVIAPAIPKLYQPNQKAEAKAHVKNGEGDWQ